MWQLWAVGWIVGVACMGRLSLFWSPNSTDLMLCIFLLLCLSVLLHLYHHLALNIARSIALVCVGFCMGFLHADQALVQRLDQRVMQKQDVEGMIYIKRLNEVGERSIQQPVEWIHPTAPAQKGIAFLTSEQAQQLNLQLGQYYRVHAEMHPIHGFATPGVFDQEQWSIQQNIMFRMRILHAIPADEQKVIAWGGFGYVQEQNTLWSKFWLWIEQQRLNIRIFIGEKSLQHQGLILGLLTGDQSFLSDETNALFRRMGMSHLLAISGPHVLVFAMLMCWAAQKVIQRFYLKWYLSIPRQLVMIIPFTACVAIYCVFVGLEIPALRTFLMCLCIALCMMMGVAYRPINLLLLSASALLWLDPFSVLSAAFWLSYGACFILLRIYQTIAAQSIHHTSIKKIRSLIGALIESQWKIFIALFPLMILFFHHIAWIAPLTNIVAIPWLGLVIVPLDVLAACSYFIFEPLSAVLFQLNDALLSVFMALLEGLDHSVEPQLIPVALNQWQWLLLILALFILFLPQGVVPKSWSIFAILPVLNFAQQPAMLEIKILDVGQGQAISIQTDHHHFMIDVGGRPDENKFGIGEQVIVPFLLKQGVSKLDRVVLTHLDQDHSGALPSILNKLTVKEIYANEKLETVQKTDFDYCMAGQIWQWGDIIEARVLFPKNKQEKRLAEERNENSCVIYLTLKQVQPQQHILVMGDAGWQTEYQLIQDFPDLTVDVLVLGHHGSRHSSAYDFLRHYRPKMAVVSAGFANRYQHPSPLTQARLAALAIPLYSTIEFGTLSFQTKGKQLYLYPYRAKKAWLKRQDQSEICVSC